MRRITSPTARGRSDRGFALIEALIAIVIFSLGALGLLGLQVSMMKATSGAKFRADAANLAAYRDSCSSHLPCRNWIAKVSQTLPGNVPPELEIVPSTGYVGIKIFWIVPNEAQHSFNTSTSINR